jgi:D-3-phosphoglycerate dehydrogenase
LYNPTLLITFKDRINYLNSVFLAILNNVLMRKFSLDKSKIKVLLLEGIHENAVQFFLDNGYSNIECLNEALSGNDLGKKIQNTNIIGIRSRTELRKDLLPEASKLLAIGCFSI